MTSKPARRPAISWPRALEFACQADGQTMKIDAQETFAANE